MIIGGCDIETTGLSQEGGHRIIEICFRLYDSETKKLVDTYTQRISPKRSIDAKAMEVHHITPKDLIGCPTWDEVADDIARFMGKCDVVVCHNVAFDIPFIALELVRIGEDFPNVEVFCTMMEGTWATPNGKRPKLGELCFALDVPYDATLAHSAEYDVDVMMKCLFRGIELGFYTLPVVEKEEVDTWG